MSGNLLLNHDDLLVFGQPPADIIKDLAPGLQFDENGTPIMPGMGPGILPNGQLPNLAEVAGMAGDNPNCSIM